MTFLGRLNSPKFDFLQNLSGGKMIKFQQSQALTSHFKSFWSIVCYCSSRKFCKHSRYFCIIEYSKYVHVFENTLGGRKIHLLKRAKFCFNLNNLNVSVANCKCLEKNDSWSYKYRSVKNNSSF